MTEGKGKYIEEGEEKSEDEEPLKRKGKVIITRPAKPSTIVFTRRSSRKKVDKEGGDIIFERPPPTFQERMKELELGAGIRKFKVLKYETRTDEEHKQIEDLVISKMGKWKYSLDQLTHQIPNVLMEKIKPRWENAMKIEKYIYEKTLRELMSSLDDKEVKESLKKNEEKLTLRFNTCLV